MKQIEVLLLQPIQFLVQKVGPFQMADPFVIAFLGPHRNIGGNNRDWVGGTQTIELRRPARVLTPAERDRSLANLCYFHDLTGRGMSAVLDYVHLLFELMSTSAPDRDRTRSRSGIRKESRIQLDLLATCLIDDEKVELVLSVWLGEEAPPIDWTPALAEDIWQAEKWAHIGFDSQRLALHETPDHLGEMVLSAIQKAEGTVEPDIGPVRLHGSARTDHGRPLPTVIRFGRVGAFPATGYAPARSVEFELRPIVTALIERLAELPTARRKRFLFELSARVFDGDEDDRPQFQLLPGRLVYSDKGRIHDLDLDDVEIPLFVVHATVMLYGTRNTIVLIDEIDRIFDLDDLDYLHRSLAKIIEYRKGTIVLNGCSHLGTINTFIRQSFPGGIVKGGARTAGLYRWR